MKLKVPCKLFEIRVNKTLIGRCRLYHTSGKSSILADFIIYKRFRNKGYAKNLLSKVLKSKRNIMLWVKQDNEIAIGLYKKYGFKEIGQEENKIVMLRTNETNSR